jgi:ATP-binding cassette subfamily B protein
MAKRSFLAYEVIQTSAMDCGPAALKCLFEGFGLPVSYGRLREACQTDVDGTSIDTLEEIAQRLGLDAEQNMLPLDQVLLKEADSLPALIVVQMPNGATHFVVIWQAWGPFLQIMDPGSGRRWTTAESFLREVFIHEQTIPAAQWRDWAMSNSGRALFVARLTELGADDAKSSELFEAACNGGVWLLLAALDTAIRLTQTLVNTGALRRGDQAVAAVQRFLDHPELLPEQSWAVRADDDLDNIRLRGAVFISVSGKKASAEEDPHAPALSPELAAAMKERPARPGLELLRFLKDDGLLTPAVLTGAILLAAAGTMVEALLLRGLLDLGRELQLSGQRLVAYAAVILLTVTLLFIELPLARGILRLGRQLENRLRLAFLRKIPLLGDRYFQSRPKSDMAERSHSIHRIRHLPELGGRVLRSFFELAFTAAGIIWLDPAAWPLVFLACLAAVILPLLGQGALNERDLRLRVHAGALGRFYLDALLGMIPIRTHGAQPAMRQAHRELLREWAGAGLALQVVVARVEGFQMAVGFGLCGWLLFDHFARHGQTGSALLLVYWALNLPAIAQELALSSWQYPVYRNVTLRLLEPLGAIEQTPAAVAASGEDVASPEAAGMVIEMEGVNVRASGHLILNEIDVRIEAGSHVAIVGPSGAGKSSFAGLLLGWYRPAEGVLRMDGRVISEEPPEDLRRQIAWVNPEVQLWNKTVLENLAYGGPPGAETGVTGVIEAADLRGVLERLPEGMQTVLGEGGARVSGGEGQRLRLGRALLRDNVRLAILDEPFRGLDQQRRQTLLARCREWWSGATLVCITHDVGHALTFDRVLVIEAGRVVEDGVPSELAAQPSRYRDFLDAEAEVAKGMWQNTDWRRVELHEGQLIES